ncbi:MAG: CotH kinase family protein [Opitutaceae bacterium]
MPGSSRDYDIYDPEPVTDAQAAALTGWLNRMTTALASADFKDPASANYHGRWLDTASFIDRTLWLELCKEVDAYTFSYYFSKDRGGPMKAFPLWDVDRSLGNANYAYSNASAGMKWWVAGSNYTYYTRLQQDPEFVDRYWNRWTALRRSHFSREKLFSRIESVYSLLSDGSRADIVSATTAATMAVQAPAARHYRKYPILGTVSLVQGLGGQANRTTWRQEVDALKTWLAERLEWMDGAPQAIDANTLVERLRPVEPVAASSGEPAYGGIAPSAYRLRLNNPNPRGGITYYTIDGPDPRQTGGALDPSARTAAAGAVTASTFLAAGQSWRWSLPSAAPAADATGLAWTSAAYADGAWNSGTAPLGYGETTGLATNISPVAPNYTAAYSEPGPAYFRASFQASGVSSLSSALLEVLADDGAVVYLNGVEAARINFPQAPTPVTYGQEALGPVDPGNNYGPIETMFVRVPIDAKLLREGDNTIAVEVHQAAYEYPPNAGNAYPRNDFSDLRFDLRVIGLTASAPGDVITLPATGAHTLRARVLDGTTWSPLTEATYVMDAAPAGPANLVVSEFHYHPSDPTPDEIARGFNSGNDFEFIELMNISRSQTVDLTGVKLEDAVAFDFSSVPPALRLLPPGGRIVVVENAAAFAARLEPGVLPVVAGAFSGNLSNGGEQIIVRAADGGIIRRFTYRDAFPWPEEADGGGASLVLSNPASNPDHNLASSWHARTPRAIAAAKPLPLAPQISTPPAGRAVLLGADVSLAVNSTAAGPMWYQWLKDGAPIEGATKATLALGAVTPSSPGTYTVVVGNEGGTTTSLPARVAVSSASSLTNLSVRTNLAAGQTLTLGAVIGGGSRTVLIRAAGPVLSAFGLAGMADPRLDLFLPGATTASASNDDWPAALAPAFGAAGAFPFPAGSRDAALSQSVSGPFTVRAGGPAAGIVLVEAYDTGGAAGARLVNVSARNRVGTGDDILIAGFSVTGAGAKQVLIRAVGPTLAAFGVTGFLADPTVRVLDAKGASVGVNDNWTAALLPTFTQVGAFPLTAGSRDAALLVTVPAGATYTIQVSGVNNGTGEALVEVYEVF